MSNSLWPHGLNISWNSPGQKMYWIAFPFFRGSSQPRDLNLGLPHWGQILYQLNHKGSPRILERVTYPFSRGSSWPRNQTRVSCIAGPKRVRQIVIVNIHVRDMLQTGSWEAWKPKQKEDVDKYISWIFRKDVHYSGFSKETEALRHTKKKKHREKEVY